MSVNGIASAGLRPMDIACNFGNCYNVKESLYMDSIIEQVFIYGIISTVIVIAMIVATLVFVRWALKDNKHFKLIFTFCIAVASDSYRGCTAADTAALCLRRDMCCSSSPFSSCFLPRIVQHFAHFSHLPVTYCTTLCCNCQG